MASPSRPALRKRQGSPQAQNTTFNERFPVTNPEVIVKTNFFALVKERKGIYCYRLFNGKIYRKDPNQSVWKSEEPVESGAFLPTRLAVDNTSFQLTGDGQLEITFRGIAPAEEEPPVILKMTSTIPAPNTSTEAKNKYSAEFEEAVFNAETAAEKEIFFNGLESRPPLLAAQYKMPIKAVYLNSAFLAFFLASEYFGWATKASDVLVEQSGLRSLVQKNAPESALNNPKTFAALASLTAFVGSRFIKTPTDYAIIKALVAAWPTYKITYAALKKNDAEPRP